MRLVLFYFCKSYVYLRLFLNKKLKKLIVTPAFYNGKLLLRNSQALLTKLCVTESE